MDKKPQDLAWAVLPKGNKVYCRNMYRTSHDGNVIDLLERLYGLHNLTSDAEGEEVLTVSRKQIQEIYSDNCVEIHRECVSSSDKDCYQTVNEVLKTLFGSKCLPDETVSDCYQLTEPKPAEPKYRKGEKVRYNGYVYEIEGLVGRNRYALKGLNFDLYEDLIEPYEPYTEPDTSHEMPVLENHSDDTSQKEVNMNTNRNLSQNIVDCDKQLDNILKDSFRNERRLTIAAMAMQGILTNESRMSRYEDMATVEPCERLTDIVARNALRYADALIAECEKGGLQ